jgi:hypothetical protein
VAPSRSSKARVVRRSGVSANDYSRCKSKASASERVSECTVATMACKTSEGMWYVLDSMGIGNDEKSITARDRETTEGKGRRSDY